ncbi:MAG: amidase domain-containing protein [Bacillota bacterium]
MKISMSKKIKYKVFSLITALLILTAIYMDSATGAFTTMAYMNEEVANAVNMIFQNRSIAIVNGDLELIQSMFNTETKYGLWAFEYEKKKVKYIENWEQKQGVRFIEIVPRVVIRRIKEKEDRFSVNLLCSTEYKYKYENDSDVINRFRIGTYHVLDLVNKDGLWIIAKEWYKDPFADSLNLENIKADSIKEYITSQTARDFSDLNPRRISAVEYADKYCGAASEEHNEYKYNKKYRNYNSQGGDCANFASQILHEGGKFKKTSRWGYDSGGATRAWVNADGFKSYWLNSGRASLIAYGSYEKVYKASYKLLPGDFVAYEKKGDITHISVVTGADSKGYSLVSCHNTDRNKVPWDLGWSDKKIKFWLVRVHF